MQPKEFGVFADFLEVSNSNIDPECIFRICAGRHYYEVFHVVKEWLKTYYPDQYCAAGGATHQALRVCCNLLQDSENEDNFEKLELKLKALHDLRVNADYHLDRVFSSGKLITMKVEKERIYKLLDLLFAKHLERRRA